MLNLSLYDFFSSTNGVINSYVLWIICHSVLQIAVVAIVTNINISLNISSMLRKVLFILIFEVFNIKYLLTIQMYYLNKWDLHPYPTWIH